MHTQICHQYLTKNFTKIEQRSVDTKRTNEIRAISARKIRWTFYLAIYFKLLQIFEIYSWLWAQKISAIAVGGVLTVENSFKCSHTNEKAVLVIVLGNNINIIAFGRFATFSFFMIGVQRIIPFKEQSFDLV